MKISLIFLILIYSCSGLKSQKNIFSLENIEKIKIGSNKKQILEQLGPPHKKYDLEKYSKTEKLLGWYYYDTSNTSQFKTAIFFDKKLDTVKKISWGPSIDEYPLRLDQVKNRYPSGKFKKFEKWLGAHSGRSITYYYEKQLKITIDYNPVRKEVTGITFE